MVRTGLEQASKLWPKSLNGARVGLLVHPASVDKNITHAVDICTSIKKFTVTALFGPQHGIRGETQDNMIEWEGFRDSKTGLPVYSLYGHSRKPDTGMLKNIDTMVVDLQDAGSRYYTFIWTMYLCMQACEEMHKSFVILDRPNPIGGLLTEGPVLDSTFASFVGLRPLSVRHGMTIGETGTYFHNEFFPDLDSHVIPLQGWERKLSFDHTGLPWVIPSPNMPTPDTALVYPGMCLLEGTNLSEGRGTTRPFEIFGAPFIDPLQMTHHMKHYALQGVTFRPLHFQPTFQKHAGKICGGAQIHVTNKNTFRPFKTGVAVLKIIHDLYQQYFSWKQPPYEYEPEKLPIDILAGTDRLRKEIEKGAKLDHMEEWWQEECHQFNRTIRKRYLLYK